MLLKVSELTGDDSADRASLINFEKRVYINTSMITSIGPVAGDPDSTFILMIDRSKTLVKKPVEEVVEILKEHDRSLAI